MLGLVSSVYLSVCLPVICLSISLPVVQDVALNYFLSTKSPIPAPMLPTMIIMD